MRHFSRGIFISQKKYCLEILWRFHLDECKVVDTSMEVELQFVFTRTLHQWWMLHCTGGWWGVFFTSPILALIFRFRLDSCASFLLDLDILIGRPDSRFSSISEVPLTMGLHTPTDRCLEASVIQIGQVMLVLGGIRLGIVSCWL